MSTETEEVPKEEEEVKDNFIPEESWFYVDEEGEQQGPFETSKMKAWYDAGYFTLDTKVKSADKDLDEFVAISAKPFPFVSVAADAASQPTAGSAEEKKPSLGWKYIDQNGIQQGPFESSKMKSWLEAGYFQDDTRVRLEGKENDFVALGLRSNKQTLFDTIEVAPAEKKWFYMDDSGVPQGPWSKKQMAKWWKAGFFAFKDLRLRQEGETDFLSISQRKQTPEFIEEPFAAAPAEESPSSVAAPTAYGEPLWVYLDKEGKEQGPWNSAQMRTWHSAGLLSLQVKVKQVGESTFLPIGARDCCFTRPAASTNPDLAARPDVGPPQRPVAGRPPAGRGGLPTAGPGVGMPLGPVPLAMGGPEAAIALQVQLVHQTQAASAANTKAPPDLFNKLLKMDSNAPKTAMGYWEKRGMPGDREGRQLSTYFDMESWQQRMNIIKAAEEEAGEPLSNRKKRKIKD